MAQFIEMVPLAEEAIPLLEEGAAATGRILSRAGGMVRRTAAGRAIAREAQEAARYIGRASIRRAAGVTRSAGRDLATEIGGISRNLIRRYGGAYRVAQKGASALGTGAAAYKMFQYGRKMLRGKRKLTTRPGPTKKKKRKLVISGIRPTRAFKVADVGKRFRKPVKPRQFKHAVRRTFDDYGRVNKNHGAWVGFQHHASTVRLYDLVGEALLKAMLATVRVYPTTYDEPILPNGAVHQAVAYRLVVEYKRIGQSSGAEEVATGGNIPLVNSVTGDFYSFKEIAAFLADEIYNRVTANPATAPNGDTVGYFPYRFTIYNYVGGAVEPKVFQKSLDNCMLDLTVKQKVRLQNLTPNDAGTDATDVNGTNPIQGKYYQFIGAPRVKGEIVKQYDAAYGLASFQADYNASATGVLVLQDQGTDSPIGHPPAASHLFENCKKTQNVAIGAGGQKFLWTTFHYKGTIEQLAKKHGYTGYDRVTIGGVTWFGFEQAFRQGQNSVIFGFNREVHMTGRATFRNKPVIMSHYDQTDLGDDL
jgi:hypothetical protein